MDVSPFVGGFFGSGDGAGVGGVGGVAGGGVAGFVVGEELLVREGVAEEVAEAEGEELMVGVGVCGAFGGRNVVCTVSWEVLATVEDSVFV